MKENHRIVTEETIIVVGGVDMHNKVHHVVVLSETAALLSLGTAEFPATLGGHKDLLDWMRSFGAIGSVGMEDSNHLYAAFALLGSPTVWRASPAP